MIKILKKMTKERKKLIILIITKDDPNKLKNILLSIQNNSLLKFEILIIDNSNKDDNRIKNSKFVFKLKKNKIIYVDKIYWKRIKEIFFSKIKGKKVKKILRSINLGMKCWDTHHARNAAAIICSLLYKDSDIVLSLDDDMIMPIEFYFNTNKIDSLKGVLLRGSPDLSRLEWMKLYNRLLDKNFNSQKIGRDYVSLLIKSFDKSFLRGIIGSYTNLLKHGEKDNKVIFPKREELNAGSFIASIQNIIGEMYPSWFDNDWFWFRRIRSKNNYLLKFTNNSIIHLSYKKNIFNRKLLKFEEIGKIITAILKNKKQGYLPKSEEVKKEIIKRKNIIEKEIEISKLLKSMIKDKNKKEKIFKIIFNLEFLIKSLKLIKTSYIIKQINSYEERARNWQSLLDIIRKYNNTKQELFKILNRDRILIFSPHCDDAIFSLGGTIKEGYFKNIEVYNIYTKTNYYLNKFRKIKNITQVRHREEYKAFKKFGIFPKFLEFNDSTKREYISERNYLSPLNNPRKDSSFIKVKKRVNKIVKNKRDIILLFPLGLGYNIDHIILFKIGEELDDKGYKVLFYEDMGYNMTKNENLIIEYLKKKNLQLTNRTFYLNDVRSKIKLCEIYNTQISRMLLRDIKEIAIKRKGERIWGTVNTFRILNL